MTNEVIITAILAIFYTTKSFEEVKIKLVDFEGIKGRLVGDLKVTREGLNLNLVFFKKL